MKLKIKSKIIRSFLALFSITISILIFQGCEKMESNEGDQITFEKLKSTYDLKIVNELPVGIKYKQVSNLAELELILRKISNRKILSFEGKVSEGKLKIISPFTKLRLKSGTEGYEMSVDPPGWWFQSLSIQIYCDGNNVTDISSAMVGFTLGAGWTQQGYTSQFNSQTNEISFHIDGIESYYLFIEGIGTLYQNPVSVDGWYNSSTGEYGCTF